MVCVDVFSAFTVSVNVLTVSQPPVVLATVSVSEYPHRVTWRSKVYGNCLLHTAMNCVDVFMAFTVSVNVITVSQPLVVLGTVSVIVCDSTNACASQVFGN